MMTDQNHQSDDDRLLGAMHASLGVTFSTDASYSLGTVKLQKRGFANIPSLVLPVFCKAGDFHSVIPVARQAAYGWLAERGVSHEHLALSPNSQRSARRSRFVDQHGNTKMGENHLTSFDLSETLAAAVTWEWNGVGTLRAGWEL